MCVSENRENSDSGHDVGRLINTLSHQLKRQMCIQEGGGQSDHKHAETGAALYSVSVS